MDNLKSFCMLTPIRCANFAEAACVCLEKSGHLPGVILKVEGSYSDSLILKWAQLHPEVFSSWENLDETVETAAYALAIFCIWEITSYQIIRQSTKGSGFDFWLGGKSEQVPFRGKAKLEVSGILRGSRGQINFRVKEKLQQASQSQQTDVPVVVVVVEFSRPLAKIASQ